MPVIQPIALTQQQQEQPSFAKVLEGYTLVKLRVAIEANNVSLSSHAKRAEVDKYFAEHPAEAEAVYNTLVTLKAAPKKQRADHFLDRVRRAGPSDATFIRFIFDLSKRTVSELKHLATGFHIAVPENMTDKFEIIVHIAGPIYHRLCAQPTPSLNTDVIHTLEAEVQEAESSQAVEEQEQMTIDQYLDLLDHNKGLAPLYRAHRKPSDKYVRSRVEMTAYMKDFCDKTKMSYKQLRDYCQENNLNHPRKL